jgi:hypothetical protein
VSRRLLIPLFILLISATTSAQSKDVKSSAAKDEAAKEKAARDLEAERILKERRANAQSLLVNLAADARNFTDQALRARTLARIADTLWDTDRDRARTIFRSAWDAAEIADKESDERFQEARRQARTRAGGGGGGHVDRPPDIRREVLRLATKHDRALGEEFLAKLKTQKKEAADENGARARTFGQSDEAIRQRLGVALEMLEAGDIDKALQFADPALTTVSIPTIDFLSFLREKDPPAADRRYAAMLAAAAADPQSDANMVSLLSSYVFTPHLYASFGSGGSNIQMSSDQRLPPIEVTEVRASFLSTAASILLRPLAPPAPGQPAVDDGQLMVIRRLLPLFEQFARPEMTASLRNQLAALESTAGTTGKRADDESMREGLEPEQPEAGLNSILDRLEHAKTAAERDEIRVELAERLATKGDLKAREYVEKIDDSELRNRARAFIDSTLAAHAVDAKKTELALEVSRIGDLTHLLKSWLLAQTAKLLATKDRDRALSLIEESAAEARRLENSDPDRPRAFLAVANALLTVNPVATWDVMSDAIKAANSADKFNGEDGKITIKIETKQMGSINNFNVPDFDVAGIFGKLANEDFDKSIELARGFERQAPRASATIAIARSVLEEKKKK